MSEESTRKVVTTREREKKKIARTTTDALYSVCAWKGLWLFLLRRYVCTTMCSLRTRLALVCEYVWKRKQRERERGSSSVVLCDTTSWDNVRCREQTKTSSWERKWANCACFWRKRTPYIHVHVFTGVLPAQQGRVGSFVYGSTWWTITLVHTALLSFFTLLNILWISYAILITFVTFIIGTFYFYTLRASKYFIFCVRKQPPLGYRSIIYPHRVLIRSTHVSSPFDSATEKSKFS